MTGQEYSIPVDGVEIRYSRGYQHPHPLMREIMAGMEAITPEVEAAKRGTIHEEHDGWTLTGGRALCVCGADLREIIQAAESHLCAYCRQPLERGSRCECGRGWLLVKADAVV